MALASKPRSFILLGLLVALTSGCLVLPIPHKSLRNSYLSGKIVDDTSGTPLSDVSIALDDSGSFYGSVRTETIPDGTFELKPTERWGFFVILAFLPFESFSCVDRLHIHASPKDGGYVYGDQWLEVRSCPPTPLLFHEIQSNLEIRDDLGEIRLKRIGRGVVRSN